MNAINHDHNHHDQEQVTAVATAIGVETIPPKKEYRDPQVRYWLLSDPSIQAKSKTNSLNVLCRLLVDRGITGPAEVYGTDGKLRFTVRSIERYARWNLRETPTKPLFYEPYDPDRPSELSD